MGNKNSPFLRSISIPEGTLPQETPLDLFLLIAGLMHPNYKVRLSVSESLCCPFLELQDEYEDNHVSIASVQRGMQYEEVTQSMSRLERIRDSNLSQLATDYSSNQDDAYLSKQGSTAATDDCIIPDDEEIEDDY